MRERLAGRTFAVAIGAVFMAVLFVAVPGSANAKYASFVIEADTGRVLHSVNADTRNYPASLAKMMTLYLVFEALKRGDLHMETELKVSARAERQPASRLGLRRDQHITVRDAILALITKSANDVATLVAEHLAGSEHDFARKMTAKARKIGMARTTFRNAFGLGNRGQLSTARDMATLALALIRDFPEQYSLFSTTRYTHGGRTYTNHNKLLTAYGGTDGIKTGYIRASGFNLVASVKRGETRLVGVVFGGKSAKQRNRHMVRLLKKGFQTLEQDAQEQAKPLAEANPSLEDMRDPTNRPPTGANQGWGIQVGAFTQQSNAWRVVAEVASVVPELLETGHTTVLPLIQKSGRQLFRSRIHGITRQQAYRACMTLERRQWQCMKVRISESSGRLAALRQ